MTRPRYWVETEGGGLEPGTLADMGRLYGTPEGNDARRVALDEEGGVSVSTVFLCLDHYYDAHPNRAPVLYETMVFGGAHDQDQRRYCTREQALAGHAEVCREVLGREPKGE